MKCDGVQGLLGSGIDGGALFDDRRVAFPIVDLRFRPLCNHGAIVAYDYLFGVFYPELCRFGPLFNELFLKTVYLPSVWADSFAA